MELLFEFKTRALRWSPYSIMEGGSCPTALPSPVGPLRLSLSSFFLSLLPPTFSLSSFPLFSSLSSVFYGTGMAWAHTDPCRWSADLDFDTSTVILVLSIKRAIKIKDIQHNDFLVLNNARSIALILRC